MAVSGIKGTGIGQVTLPEFGGPMALQAGLRAAEPEYVEDITGGVQDYTGGLTGAGLGLIDILGDFLGKATDERLRAGTSTQPITTNSFQAGDTTRDQADPSQEPIIYQDEIMRIAESLKKTMPEKTTGSFQAGDTTRDQVDPTQSGQQNIGLSDDEEAAMAGADAAGDATEDVIRTSVQDYLDIIGKKTKATTTEEYIQEFADATGLDVSGKPDKSTALMTFGLALMQNKAGKGFDVGKMLGSVGEAGEKALPAFEKAKSEARALRAKAGEYALGRTREDEKLARQRGGYYIVPKSKGLAGRIKAFTEDSKRADLNAFELEALYGSEGFRKNFDVIPASEYNDVYKELTKKPEYGDMYASSYESISLFNDAPDDLQIGVQRVNANYKGPNAPTRGYFNPGEYDVYAGRLNSMKSGLDKTAAKLAEAYSIVNADETTTMDQIGDAAVGLGRALGIKIGEGASPTAKVIRILNVISAERAPEILGEAGKTISDADRARVQDIVGRLEKFSDPETLKLALNDMYDTIVVGGYNDVNQGFSTLNMYANRTPASRPTGLKKNKDGRFSGVVDVTKD